MVVGTGEAAERAASPGIIGMFDSGWGGLSVAAAVREAVPRRDVVYIGDHAWCPYGGRDEATISARAVELTGWLAGQGAEIVVIACNTASALALAEVRRRFPGLTVVGVVPAVKPAARQSRSGRIAVLATPATAASAYLADLTRDHAAGVDTTIVPAPGLVELVESGVTDGSRAEAAILQVLAAPLAAGVDTIVLGCTHYPFLRPVIERIAGPGVSVIDSGQAIGRRVRSLAGGSDLERSGQDGSIALFTTGEPATAAAAAARLLGRAVDVRKASV